MTPENMPPPSAGPATPAIRPPDFLLPKTDPSTGRQRGGEGPSIYVSWGGKIYGPSGIEDVMGGMRTAYFGEDALFWFEGCTDWRPVEELPALLESEATELPAETGPPRTPPPEPIRPHWPSTQSSERSSRGSRRRRNRKGRTSQSARRTRAGRLIVIGAVLLAVALTAGLLLLVSLA